MPTVKPDGSYALGCPIEQERRTALLNARHASPLRDFVSELRQTTKLSVEIPDFDPADGGIDAKVLFLLEAPGPEAVLSGFISRDNPDSTARKFRSLLQNAGFTRSETAIWNIIPYYIGDESRSQIRAATPLDVQDGFKLLLPLKERMCDIKAIVLMGLPAQKSKKEIEKYFNLPTFGTFHCSSRAINGHKHVLPTIEKNLLEVKQFISS